MGHPTFPAEVVELSIHLVEVEAEEEVVLFYRVPMMAVVEAALGHPMGAVVVEELVHYEEAVAVAEELALFR